MDLLSIARKFWRHKFATLPVVVLTICGAAYVVAVKAPQYEASSSYVLINPPSAPTPDDIARNPALGRLKADNPYTRFADQSVVIDVLARTVNNDVSRKALVRAGADPRYTVASGAPFGSSSPIVQITGTGASPEAAIQTATLVGRAVTNELDRMQQVRDVDPKYRIAAMQIDGPDQAKLQASGKLRTLIGVLVLGAILLFVIVSVTDAMDRVRVERVQRMALADLAAERDERGAPRRGDPSDGFGAAASPRDRLPEAWRSERDEDGEARPTLLSNRHAPGVLAPGHEHEGADR